MNAVRDEQRSSRPLLQGLRQLWKFVATLEEIRERLLKQNAITFEGRPVTEGWPIQKGVLKIGKRRFLKLV